MTCLLFGGILLCTSSCTALSLVHTHGVSKHETGEYEGQAKARTKSHSYWCIRCPHLAPKGHIPDMLGLKQECSSETFGFRIVL
jgi:hypothetical protein